MKTIEEAAKEFEECNGEKIWHENENSGQALCIESFKKGVEFAQRWIPVEEELPIANDHSIDIEMKLDNNVKLTGYLFADGDWMKYTEDGRGLIITERHVTHWRPIELK
jgi:hypothetical protein